MKTLMVHKFRQLVVVHNRTLDGLLRRRDIMKWLKLQTDINDGTVPGRRALAQNR